MLAGNRHVHPARIQWTTTEQKNGFSLRLRYRLSSTSLPLCNFQIFCFFTYAHHSGRPLSLGMKFGSCLRSIENSVSCPRLTRDVSLTTDSRLTRDDFAGRS